MTQDTPTTTLVGATPSHLDDWRKDLDRAKRPVLYPHTEGGWPPCQGCYTRQPNQADTVKGKRIQTLCPDCAAGKPPRPLTGDEWESLAHLHVNGEVDDDLITDALTQCAAHLTEVDAHLTFIDLREALLRRQRVTEGDITAFDVEPDLAHPERLAQLAQENVDAALAELCGGAR